MQLLSLTYPQVPTIMHASFLLPLLLAGAVLAAPKTDNDLTCSICIDIVTQIDNYITSDTTEQQVTPII